jgi:uncharacterized protein YbaP (TraB family)
MGFVKAMASIKTRCLTAVGMLHLVGDGELVKLLKIKHLSECK